MSATYWGPEWDPKSHSNVPHMPDDVYNKKAQGKAFLATGIRQLYVETLGPQPKTREDALTDAKKNGSTRPVSPRFPGPAPLDDVIWEFISSTPSGRHVMQSGA